MQSRLDVGLMMVLRASCLAFMPLVGCRREPVRTDSVASASPPAASSAPATTPPISAAPTSSPSALSGPLPPPAKLDASTSVVVDPDNGEKLAAWTQARVVAAKNQPELVRVPLVRRDPGWGCICPEHYVGVSTTTAGDKTVWLTPTFAPTAPSLPPDTVVLAEGYFSGGTSPFEPGTNETFDKATLHEFHVLRHRPVASPEDGAGTKAEVVLDGADAHHETPAPADGLVFLLVAASIPIGDAAKATAETTRERLVAKGFLDASIVDTRTTPGLFCCHLAVVASRHATATEAQTAALAAKKKGVSLLVRRAW